MRVVANTIMVPAQRPSTRELLEHIKQIVMQIFDDLDRRPLAVLRGTSAIDGILTTRRA